MTDANLVPLSESGWGVVLAVTVVLAVVWVAGVAVVSRVRDKRRDTPSPVDAQSPHEPTAAARFSARTLLVVVVGLAVVTLVVFLLGRVGDLLA